MMRITVVAYKVNPTATNELKNVQYVIMV